MNLPKIIVARYNENIDWIIDNNLQDRCIVYNKSPLNRIFSKKYGDLADKLNIVSISNNPSFGREGDTYLNHIVSNYSNLDDYTIFTQADPFDHSPNFIEIINYLDINGWKDYQPLSCYWLKSVNIPPQEFVENETSEYVGNFPVRQEECDANALTIKYYDNGMFWIASQYRNTYRLSYDVSIMDHFGNYINKKIPIPVKFAFGAIFGVNRELIVHHPISLYQKLLSYVRSKSPNGYILERMWYTIFKEL